MTIARAPGSDRLFVAELGGQDLFLSRRPDCETPDLFLDLGEAPRPLADLRPRVPPRVRQEPPGLRLLCPEGERSRRDHASRASRSADTDPPRVDPKSEDHPAGWPSGGHNGGCLQFGPDGYPLHLDRRRQRPHPARQPRHRPGPQRPARVASSASTWIGPTSGKPYGIPPDNPFVNAAGRRPEIWAYGFRNPWKMCFDPKTGDLWVGDVGWEMWEMVYRVERGGNYGWSVVEGRQPVRPEAKRGPTPILPPTVEHPHTEARSITGGPSTTASG